MPIKEIQEIDVKVVNLLLDVNNPRFETQSNQREAISKMIDDQGPKLVNLANSIAEYGLNPSEMPMVIRAMRKGHYVVVEGNRRVAAIKLLSSTNLVDSLNMKQSLSRKLKALN